MSETFSFATIKQLLITLVQKKGNVLYKTSRYKQSEICISFLLGFAEILGTSHEPSAGIEVTVTDDSQLNLDGLSMLRTWLV